MASFDELSYIERSILATLIYYDQFDFPLRVDELWYSLVRVRPRAGEGQTVSQAMFDSALKGLVGRNLAHKIQGYYLIDDRRHLVPLRLERERIARRKFALLKRIGRWLALVPTVEAMFVSGSLTYGNTSELSDLDVLIVSGDSRVWTTRLIVLAVLAMFRRRRTRDDIIAPDKVCPNHFITLSSLQVPFHSLYNAQTYAHLRPLFQSEPGLYASFVNHNDWLNSFCLNNPNAKASRDKPMLSLVRHKVWRSLFGLPFRGALGIAIESIARRIQLRIIGERGLARLNKREIRVCDHYLALHDVRHEDDLLARFTQRCEIYGIDPIAKL